MEHNEVKALMERWATKAATERSSRKLVLHTEAEAGTPAAGSATRNTPHRLVTRRRRLVRWSIAASVAAAIVAGVAVLVTPGSGPEPEAPVICTVNGELITDPARIEQYTREALELADENLRRPGVTLASTLGDGPTMAHVGEMLNELTSNK